jgi:hypothetical protein
VFRNRLVSSPRSVIYKVLFFMQRWTGFSTGEDRVILEKLIEKIRNNVGGILDVVSVG